MIHAALKANIHHSESDLKEFLTCTTSPDRRFDAVWGSDPRQYNPGIEPSSAIVEAV
jgi:hypothetical protein